MTTLDHFNTETGEVNIQLFNKTEAGLAELNKLYSKVPEIITKDDYEFVKNACSELTGLRTSIEKTRKAIKQPYIDAGRAIDDRAKEITEKIRKLEDPMKEAKKAHDEIEKRKKEERLARLREKVDAIKAYAVNARGKSASEIEDIIEGTELGQSEELREVINIIRQQESASAVSLGATQATTGAVTGLLES